MLAGLQAFEGNLSGAWLPPPRSCWLTHSSHLCVLTVFSDPLCSSGLSSAVESHASLNPSTESSPLPGSFAFNSVMLNEWMVGHRSDLLLVVYFFGKLMFLLPFCTCLSLTHLLFKPCFIELPLSH